jgi:hypothetical protein
VQVINCMIKLAVLRWYCLLIHFSHCPHWYWKSRCIA